MVELVDDSKDEKRLEKAEQYAERKVTKQKKKHVEPHVVHWGTRFVSNPATGSRASSGKQTGYQVPRQPGMIRCSSHCNAKDCIFVICAVNTFVLRPDRFSACVMFLSI